MDNNEKYVDHLIKRYRIFVRGSIEFALSTVKISLLINGGALIALLTFSGSSAIKVEGIQAKELASFFAAFEPFIYGVILATIASGLSYWHQSVAEYEAEVRIKNWLFPKEKSEKNDNNSGFRVKIGKAHVSIIALFATILVIGSYFSFIIGAFSVVEAMQIMLLAD